MAVTTPAARGKSVDPVRASTALFRALADPTRLRLLNMLRGGERCVCELVDVIGQPQPKISRHLAYLRKAGLVIGRKEGLWVHYRLAEPPTELHRRVIACVGSCLADMQPLCSDLEQLKGCCVGPTVRGKAVRT